MPSSPHETPPQPESKPATTEQGVQPAQTPASAVASSTAPVPNWRHPLWFAVISTVAFFAIAITTAKVMVQPFEELEPEGKIEKLERFAPVDGDPVANMPAILSTANASNAEIIIAGATDENPAVRAAGLKALANLLIVTRSAVDFDRNLRPELSAAMQERIDAIVLTGLANPQDEQFRLYLSLMEQLALEGDKYHQAALDALALSDMETQAYIWLHLCYALGPRAEAKEFILQALSPDAPAEAARIGVILCLYVLDESFIEPLTAIAVDTGLDTALRGMAVYAIADYGAQAQHVLPQLRPLLEDGAINNVDNSIVESSIRIIEQDTPKRHMQKLHPSGGPWRNINPLW